MPHPGLRDRLGPRQGWSGGEGAAPCPLVGGGDELVFIL